MYVRVCTHTTNERTNERTNSSITCERERWDGLLGLHHFVNNLYLLLLPGYLGVLPSQLVVAALPDYIWRSTGGLSSEQKKIAPCTTDNQPALRVQERKKKDEEESSSHQLSCCAPYEYCLLLYLLEWTCGLIAQMCVCVCVDQAYLYGCCLDQNEQSKSENTYVYVSYI